MIPFPSLRKKIRAFKEDTRSQTTLPWMPSVPTLTNPAKHPRKCTPGKVRAWWSKCNHHFNPIKINWFNMLGTNLTETNKISIIKPIPQKACEQFGPTCSFCRQQAPHPSLNQSDWSSEDWDRRNPKLENKFLY